MKTTVADLVPSQWPQILRWVAGGEEVRVVDRDRVVARLLPPEVARPNFVERAKTVWGDTPAGKTLSEIVSDERGDGQ